MRLSLLSIISCLGLILSTGAAVYAARACLALSHSGAAIDVLASVDDVMTPKIDAMLAEHKARSLITGELKARHEQNASLQSAMTKIVEESKHRARNEVVLWMGAGFFFFVLLIRAEHLRRRRAAQPGLAAKRRNPGTFVD